MLWRCRNRVAAAEAARGRFGLARGAWRGMSPRPARSKKGGVTWHITASSQRGPGSAQRMAFRAPGVWPDAAEAIRGCWPRPLKPTLSDPPRATGRMTMRGLLNGFSRGHLSPRSRCAAGGRNDEMALQDTRAGARSAQLLQAQIDEHGAWRVLAHALRALVGGRARRRDAARLSNHLRRDIGLPPSAAPPVARGQLW